MSTHPTWKYFSFNNECCDMLASLHIQRIVTFISKIKKIAVNTRRERTELCVIYNMDLAASEICNLPACMYDLCVCVRRLIKDMIKMKMI